MGSLEAADQPQKPFTEYRCPEFWQELDVGVVSAAALKTVLAATKDLCYHFIAQENPTLFLVKAAKLAAQFRNLEDGRLTELLVDHAGLQKLFTLDPTVRFDIQVSSSSCDFAIERPCESLTKGSLSWWFKGLLPWKTKQSKQSRTMFDNDRRTSRFLYRQKDVAWLHAFMSSVDALTETQALIFGPAFACLFAVLRMEAREPSGVAEVAEEMAKLCDTSFVRLPARVARMVGRLPVKMPPLDALTKLLSVYAAVKLPAVYFNTVAGGFMYARHRRGWSLLTRKDSVTFVLMSLLRYHHDLTMLVSSLDYVKALAERRDCPRLAAVYLACVERNFPDSWKAFHYVAENFDTLEPGKYDPFWRFSGAFSDRMFDELSYERNHRVCNISAVVEDRLDNAPDDEFIYEELVREKPCSLRIGRSDLLLAEEICGVLRRELAEAKKEENV